MAGGVLGQTAHHGVHLVKLAGGLLHLGVDLLVLGVLVVEHGSVLVALLGGPDRRVLAAIRRQLRH